jgi:hypothetical protein
MTSECTVHIYLWFRHQTWGRASLWNSCSHSEHLDDLIERAIERADWNVFRICTYLYILFFFFSLTLLLLLRSLGQSLNLLETRLVVVVVTLKRLGTLLLTQSLVWQSSAISRRSE